MVRRKGLTVVLASGLVAASAWFQVATAQSGGAAGGSTTDSPYKNGPPPVTGGFTDTWQGGNKTSGAIPEGMANPGQAGSPGQTDDSKKTQPAGGAAAGKPPKDDSRS